MELKQVTIRVEVITGVQGVKPYDVDIQDASLISTPGFFERLKDGTRCILHIEGLSFERVGGK